MSSLLGHRLLEDHGFELLIHFHNAHHWDLAPYMWQVTHRLPRVLLAFNDCKLAKSLALQEDNEVRSNFVMFTELDRLWVQLILVWGVFYIFTRLL